MSYETTRLGEFLNTFGKAAGLPALTLSDEGTLFMSLDGASVLSRDGRPRTRVYGGKAPRR